MDAGRGCTLSIGVLSGANISPFTSYERREWGEAEAMGGKAGERLTPKGVGEGTNGT